MCNYCEKEHIMLEQKIINRSNWGWGYDGNIKLTLIEAEEYPVRLSVFIDRGYLRLVNLDDCNCMDGGKKIKINFCPICGNRIE